LQSQFQFYGWGWKKVVTNLGCEKYFFPAHIMSVGGDAIRMSFLAMFLMILYTHNSKNSCNLPTILDEEIV
jgi:hypothetical protein